MSKIIGIVNRLKLTPEQAARVAVAGIYGPVDRKLAKRLRKKGKLRRAERRLRLAIKYST